MSTLTIFARGDRAVMLTDTAGTTPGFIVGGWVNKVACIPHLRLAMTAQGAADAVSTFADRLACELGGLDDIVSRGAAVLEDEHDLNVMRWSDDAASPEFKLGITGWSDERQRFEAYFVQSTQALNVEPFTFVRRDLVLAPVLHQSDLDQLQIPRDGAAFARDAQAYLLRLLTLQRHVTTPRPGTEGGKVGNVIGGQVVATELTREGIAQRVVHAWPDRLDEPIRPAPIALELAAVGGSPIRTLPAGGLSRQQRRAAARAGSSTA